MGEIIQSGYEFTKNRMHFLIFHSDLHATRFFLAIAEILWAITLLLPGDTFSRPTYCVMAHVLRSEEIWGTIWLFSGLMQFYILISGKYHDRFAIAFSCFNSILWWFIVVSMYLSVSPLPAAISGETALAIAAATIFIRTGWGVIASDNIGGVHHDNRTT